jgi:hypothetical protein
MKGLLLTAWCLVLLATVSAQVSQLKNSDIVELSRAGLSSESIISKIKHSACKFETEPADLIRLKSQGLSSEIIQAMIECESPTPPAAAPSPTTTEPATASLAIQAGVVYRIGAAQPVARTDFVILDDDPIKIVTNAGIHGKKVWPSPPMGILESFLFMNMGGRWDDGAAALAALKSHVIAGGTTDFNGTLLFTGLPPNKRIYVFGIAQTRGGWAAWDLWYEIPAGQVWAGVLDQKNAAIIY